MAADAAALEYSPEDVLQMGMQQGLPPDEIAAGVRKHRADVEAFGRESMGEDAAGYWKGTVKLDDDVEAVMGKLRGQAQAKAIETALPDVQERQALAKELEAGGYDPTKVNERFAPVLAAAEEAAKAPAFTMPKRVYDGTVKVGDNVLARYGLREAGDGKVDALLQFNDETQGLLRVDKATDADVKAESVRLLRELERHAQARDTAKRGSFLDPLGTALDAAGAADQRREETLQKLVQLKRGGVDYLTSLRVTEALKAPEYRDKVGGYAGGQEFLKGLVDATLTTGAAATRAAGSEAGMQVLGEARQALDTAIPGSTRRKLEGGVWNESVAGAQRALGQMAPFMTGGAVTRGATKALGLTEELAAQQAGRLGVAGAGMSTSAAGGAYLDTQAAIDEAESRGDIEKADRLRRGRDLHAILTGVAEGAVERLGAAQALNVGGRGLKHLGAEILKEGVEEPLTGLVQRGVIDPVTIGNHPDVTGPMPVEFTTGMLAAVPLVGASAVMNRGADAGPQATSSSTAGAPGPVTPTSPVAAGPITPLTEIAQRAGAVDVQTPADLSVNAPDPAAALADAGTVAGDVLTDYAVPTRQRIEAAVRQGEPMGGLYAEETTTPTETQTPPAEVDVPTTAMTGLRAANAALPEAAQARWTDEVYAQADEYFATGDTAALAGLTEIQKRRIVQARQDADPGERAAQERSDRRAEDRMSKQERANRRFVNQAPPPAVSLWADEVIDQARGRMNLGLDPVLMAAHAVKGVEILARGARTFATWGKAMVKRFGAGIMQFLDKLWQAAQAHFKQDRRWAFGGQSGTVRTKRSGAILPGASITNRGGTVMMHRQGQPFRVNDLGWRELLWGSVLPGQLTDVVARTENERAAVNQTAAEMGRDLQAAIESAGDRTNLGTVRITQMVADAMDGTVGAQTILNAVDPVVAERARRARNFLDDLSAAVAQTIPAGNLRTAIIGGMGAWMRRSYAAFDGRSGWNFDNLTRAAAAGKQVAGKDAATILANARRVIRAANPGATAAEIEADMRDLMDRGQWENSLVGQNPVRKSVGSFMKRKTIPPEIRALMGEETNPVHRLMQSTRFQAQVIARHHGQQAMRQLGLASGLFAAQRGGVYTQQIPPDGPGWSGLAGTWTTPQLWEALQRAQGVVHQGSDLWGKMGEALKALGNEAKLNAVALSPDSWAVNWLGNFIGLIMSGDVFAWGIFRRIGQALSTMRSGRSKDAVRLNAAAEALQDAARDLAARLRADGVLGAGLTQADIENSIPRELLQYLAETETRNRVAGAVKGALVGQGAGRSLGLPGRLAGAAVGAAVGGVVGAERMQGWAQRVAELMMSGPDMVARVTGWLTNYEAALRAGMNQQDAAAWASQRALNTFPNYAKLPGLLRALSRYGLMGSFIAFQYEVYRNFAWNARYAVEELASGNPALIGRGAQRLIGVGGIAALAGGGLSLLLSKGGADSGADDDRNRKFRKWFGAPWEKDSILAFSKFDDQGVSYYNTSYLLPQATMAELLQAVREGVDPADAAGRVVGRLWEQFAGSSIHLSPLLAALSNRDQNGRELTFQDGLPGLAERTDKVVETTLEPGWTKKLTRVIYALRGAEKNGRLHSVDEEALRAMGVRQMTRSWDYLTQHTYREMRDRYEKIRSQANRELGLNVPGSQQRALDTANAALKALRAEVREFESDAGKMGVPIGTLNRAKKASAIPVRIPDLLIGRDGRVVSMGGG